MGLFRAQSFQHWTQRRRIAPRGVPFSYNPATEKYTRLTVSAPYDAYSLADDANSVAGNYIIFDRYASPSGVEVFVDGDGIPYTTAPSEGRQIIRWREWRTAVGAYVVVTGTLDDRATLYINNVAPVETAPIGNRTVWTHFAVTPIIVSAGVSDAEGDALVFSGLAVPGLSIETVVDGLSTYQAITGTPTVPGSYSVSLTATDITGAGTAMTPFNLTVGAAQQVPDVIGEDQEDGLDTLAGVLTTSEMVVHVVANDEPEGEIFEVVPPAGTYIIPGSPVHVYVSEITGVVIPFVYVPRFIFISHRNRNSDI